jgi:hypothetical protein
MRPVRKISQPRQPHRLLENTPSQERGKVAVKTHINGVSVSVLAHCYELLSLGGTLQGIAARFGINKARLSKAICLAKRNGLG